MIVKYIAKNSLPALFVAAICFFSFSKIAAQTTDTTLLYGLSVQGFFYQIDPTNGNCGPAINPVYPANDTAASANAAGFDTVNKSFYYFKRNFIDTPQEFVSYSTLTNTYTTLATSPITDNVVRGCVNLDGSGYYCLDGSSNLCYYNIRSNTWTVVTSNFVDSTGTDVDTVFNTLGAGDIAFDGNGNLWILASSGTFYTLYEVLGPIPTMPVDTLHALVYVPYTTPTPVKGFGFGGIAFNSTGQILLTNNVTTKPGNQLYLLEDNLTLLDVGTLGQFNAGNDLASNSYPVSQLPVTFLSFDGMLQNNEAVLSWKTAIETNNKGFEIQKSSDGQTFNNIGYVQGHGTTNNNNSYSFSDAKLLSGDNYYRLQQIDLDGHYTYSGVIKLEFSKFGWSILGNPSNNTWLQLQLDKPHAVSVQVVSVTGNPMLIINKGNVGQGTYGIPLNLGNAPAGMYVVKLIIDGKTYSKNMVK